MFTPGESCAIQPANFPLPLPIEPATFFVMGKWGNKLNQTLREVLSALLAAFLINTLYRNICLPFTHNGCRILRPK